MQGAFNNARISNMAWEAIRKLTCCICGKTYVKHLEDVKESEEIAEEICQFIYDLRMKYKQNSHD